MYATVIIPTLNEEKHIGALLLHFLRQDAERVLQILVADGGSKDRTREIVSSCASQDSRVRLIENPLRIQASGINSAVAAADPRASVIIRVDAHAGYPANYIQSLMAEMSQRDCESVVVRLRTIGHTCFQTAVASVCNSNFGTGGSAHRVGGVSRFVDHGHHAAFKRSAFEGIGGYDPSFVANEDAEFDFRLRAAGGRVWFANDIVVDYVPRATVVALAQQYHRYGVGRAMNFRKHGGLRARQLVPPVFLLALITCLAFALLFRPLLFFPVAYLGLVAAAAIKLWRNTSESCTLGALLVIPTIHLSWALGFWRGLVSR